MYTERARDRARETHTLRQRWINVGDIYICICICIYIYIYIYTYIHIYICRYVIDRKIDTAYTRKSRMYVCMCAFLFEGQTESDHANE